MATTTEMHHNLFVFASRELSHSAYWAWVIESLVDGAPPEHVKVRPLARALLSALNLGEACNPTVVKTEHPLMGGQADIYLEFGDRRAVIENKVGAGFGKDQVQRYRAAAGHVSVISTTFYTAAKLKELGVGEVPHLGLEDLEGLVSPFVDCHWLVREHHAWLQSQLQTRQLLKREATGDDLDANRRALEHAYGQWALMTFLTVGDNGDGFSGVLRCGKNKGGRRWTQFWFAGPPGRTRGEHDSIFYRIDKCSRGYYLSLRQYQKDPFPSAEAKQRRLAELRRWWSDSHNARAPASAILQPQRRRDAVCESEIGYYLLLEAGTRPRDLRQFLRGVHEAFLEKLWSAGWTAWNAEHETRSDGR
jgi:hypothetical protein